MKRYQGAVTLGRAEVVRSTVMENEIDLGPAAAVATATPYAKRDEYIERVEEAMKSAGRN